MKSVRGFKDKLISLFKTKTPKKHGIGEERQKTKITKQN